MKAGAVLIVIDFQNDDLINWIEDITGDCSLAKKSGNNNAEWVIDPEEEKKDLGEYYKKFCYPKIRARIFYRVYIKE
jgi:hypothetical protein